MKFLISEIQKEKIFKIIQSLIDVELRKIKNESEHVPNDEFEFYHSESNEVEKIKVKEIVDSENGMKVYVDFYVNSNRMVFEYLLGEIIYRLRKVFPKILLIHDETIDERDFGPGIDW